MLLGNLEIGFADATKEYTKIPELFDCAFYDVNNITQKLIDSYYYLLIGRKGVGKTAYCSKIRNLAKNDQSIHVLPINMYDFEFSTFAKTSIGDDVSGTQKYKKSWDFILLVTLFKYMYNDLHIVENEIFNEVIYLLDRVGFDIDNTYRADIMKLSKIKMGIGVASFDLELNNGDEKIVSYLERIDLLIGKMLFAINNVFFNNYQILLIIDGLDDVLRYKKNKMEIIASLIRSVDFLNNKFDEMELKIKVILLIREDIISVLNDPDLNKIIQDSSIFLHWNDKTNELKKSC